MDPNQKESLEKYEKNAKIMYYVGFALCPLCWLMGWVYCVQRQSESEYLRALGRKCFLFFWIGVFVIGIWTVLYSAFWTSMYSIIFYKIKGEPE